MRFVKPVGFSNGCAEFALYEPAAVRPELLDRLLARDRRPVDRLRRALDGRRLGGPAEVLDDALADEDERDDDGERQEHAGRRPRQVDPEVPDRRPSGAA